TRRAMSSEQNTPKFRVQAPIALPAIGYLAGILWMHTLHTCNVLPPFFYLYGSSLLLWIIVICTSLFLCCYLLPRYTLLNAPRRCYALALSTLFFAGAWSYQDQNNLAKLPNEEDPALFYGVVEAVAPTKSQRFMRIKSRLVSYRQKEETHLCNHHSFIYIPIDNFNHNLQPGSTLLTFSKINIQTLGSTGSFLPPSIFLSRSSPFSFTPIRPSFSARWGQKLLHRLQTNIRDPDSFALLAGLSIGHKEAFDPELKSAYAGAGASHVLAVSGLHVGIIYAIILIFCNLFIPKNSRGQQMVKLLLALSALTLFAALARFTPSVTRALLMVALATSGKLLRRPVHSLQTLFATALIICILNPAAVFDIGFQLSFCAVLAILILKPPLHGILHPKTKSVNYLWSLISTSTAAQIGTAPLAYYYFGTFPYLFLITNLLVIPLTGVILYLLCVWLALGQMPVIGRLLLWVMECCTLIMNRGVRWIDHLL
ncbi:MAG: ComEC/Rec2 family competence protein, partial [Bacteroidetes bacterium]|nr:ComEC/Rec2 family competence protein [Bacteroidota bacterium]